MLLLISVSDPLEVEAAVAGGADIIDVKNPREGSLGAATPAVIRDVRARTPAHVPVSAAIGDVPDLPGTVALAAAGAAACGVQYVKIGLLGPSGTARARQLALDSTRAAREVDPSVKVILTAYADARQVGALSPLDVADIAHETRAAGCMIDTATKQSGSLFELMSPPELARFLSRCRSHGLVCALAGSLEAAHVPNLRRLAPDIVGIRTAACRGDRVTGSIDAGLVCKFKSLLAQPEHLPFSPAQ
ncbi:MAG: (5-formylfuran-3-yl)methyl phosphate synthase [Thermoleophilia bacterium]